MKALFRYGSSLRLLQDFDRSRKFLLKAYNLAPSDRSIAAEIEQLDEMIARYRQTETQMYQRMFKNLSIKSKETLAIDANNNNSVGTSVPNELIMEEKRPLEKSKELILKLFKFELVSTFFSSLELI